jgi:hypothetical protein
MNTIRTGLLALAVGLLGVSCGGDDKKGAPATSTAGMPGGGEAPGGAMAGGGATSTGGQATGGTAGAGGAGGDSATGGTGGALSAEETCGAVCTLLGGATTALTCVPDPCASTCVSEYSKLVVADQQIATGPVCAAAYLDLLSCGLSQPADSWTCFTIPQTNPPVMIPVPPYAQTTDACYVPYQNLYLTILGNNPCIGALSTP